MTFPLATYTAEHGLEWHYDKASIEFAVLDKCRHLLGALPDFNAGDSGYEGVAAVAERVFAIRCAKAAAWDFKGRDALYMTVTWMTREEARNVDFWKLLGKSGMCRQTHDYKFSFDADCQFGRAADMPDWQKHIESGDDVFVRQDLDGGKPTVRIVEKKGEGSMTEAEKTLFGKIQSENARASAAETEEAHPVSNMKADDVYSISARVFGVIVFIALILVGTYLARMTDHALAGYIVGAAAFAVLGALWKVKK